MATNEVGRHAEAVDPAYGELLDNFPQASSQIGLVNAAWAISQWEERTEKEAAHDRHGVGSDR